MYFVHILFIPRVLPVLLPSSNHPNLLKTNKILKEQNQDNKMKPQTKRQIKTPTVTK